MRKIVSENERAKRDYVDFLEQTKGLDQRTTDKVLASLKRFEQTTGYKPFRAFHIEQAKKFKTDLAKARNKRTGKPLSLATIDKTLADVRAFFIWLAGRQGYRSRLSYSDAEYFRNKRKDARIAHEERERPCPSLEAALHAFNAMPQETVFEHRDKAAFALLMLTGARVGAAASLRIKHVDFFEDRLFQDAREVRTKAAKTIDTWFFPVDPAYRRCLVSWVERLRRELFFGPDDALIPKPEIKRGPEGFEATKLSREPYASGQKLNEIVRAAFAAVALPEYTPHSFRTTLWRYGDSMCTTMEELKMWSMNLGHEHMATSISAYMPVSKERRAELMGALEKRVRISDAPGSQP